MNKLLASMVMVFMAYHLNAQVSIGGALGFGTNIEQLLISAKGKYSLNDKWDASPSINYFLPYEQRFAGGDFKFSVFTINLDGHYLLPINEKWTAYPLAGLNLAIISTKTTGSILGEPFSNKASTTDFGLNVGGGANFQINEKTAAFAEAKYVIGGIDQLVLSIGALFGIN